MTGTGSAAGGSSGSGRPEDTPTPGGGNPSSQGSSQPNASGNATSTAQGAGQTNASAPGGASGNPGGSGASTQAGDTPGSPSGPRGVGGSGARGNGQGEEGPPATMAEPYLPGNGPTRRRLPPVPLSRLIGNKDWPILIECQADLIVVRALGLRLSLSDVENGSEGRRLAEAIQKMVANRQATLRHGEPPYRPILRFQVYPEGLRTYYVVYPLLEPLGFSTMRENIEPPPKKPATTIR